MATNQVIKATHFNIANIGRIAKSLEPEGPSVLMVFYPVIVFEGKMFQYLLDRKIEPRLEEIQYTKYRTTLLGSSEMGEEFLIDIVSKDFLHQYLNWLDDELGGFTGATAPLRDRKLK